MEPIKMSDFISQKTWKIFNGFAKNLKEYWVIWVIIGSLLLITANTFYVSKVEYNADKARIENQLAEIRTNLSDIPLIKKDIDTIKQDIQDSNRRLDTIYEKLIKGSN